MGTPSGSGPNLARAQGQLRQMMEKEFGSDVDERQAFVVGKAIQDPDSSEDVHLPREVKGQLTPCTLQVGRAPRGTESMVQQ